MKSFVMKSPGNLKLLTKGQILPHIQQSISKATKSILIVGPWLDAYFTRNVIDSLPNLDINVSFLVRIEDGDKIDAKTLSALNLARENIPKFQARTLSNLHLKVIIIDDETFYLGSANWYWYSLHESLETTLCGKTLLIHELVPEINKHWTNATPLTSGDMADYNDLEPVKAPYYNIKQIFSNTNL